LKKNLVLTGMMGVGKSTIAKSLASRLKMKFIDTDKAIEKETLLTIKEIFEKKGEEHFRNIEKKIALNELNKANCVIALGGGAFMNREIREKVLKTAISFWLDLKINLILKRSFDKKKRPLLKGIDAEKTLNDLYKKRKGMYNLADYKINCDQASETVIKEIVENYANERN
tara:strand:- start:12273 stop:12785 length:513 start_codon:yes stop_codon:yes gene_type:complete